MGASPASRSEIGPVLLLGSTGMLGRAWAHFLEANGVAFTAPTSAELNLTSSASISQFDLASYQTLVNCAAFTDVDGAEQQVPLAQQINGAAVGALAERCRDTANLLVHFSTDYVFDGRSSHPYRVDSPLAPINAYGRSKVLGEQQLMTSRSRSLLVRASWLYAPWGKNFVRTIAARARLGNRLTVVDDQQGRPTSCEHLVRSTWRLMEQGVIGHYHVTDGGHCTWFDFAREIAAKLNSECAIVRCQSEDLNQPAQRPKYSVLDLSKTESLLGPMPHWTVNLADVLERLEPGA